jgi:hypothetical protein
MGNSPLALSLPALGCWEVEAPQYDSQIALRALASLTLDATDIYFEGASISREPKALLQSYQTPGRYLPKTQTLWTTGNLNQYRCRYSVSLLEALSELAERHAEPELFDSLFLYRGPAAILEWPETFHGPIWISKDVSEANVLVLANILQAVHLFLPRESG